MKGVIALALAGALMVGCSDSSTQSAAASDGGGGSADSGSTNTGGASDDGNTNASGSTDNSDDNNGSSADNGSSTSGGSTDNGNTNTGGSTDNGSDNSGGSTDSGGTGTTNATCSATDVGIAFQAVNATVISDPDAAPSELIDGCIDRSNSWSGDYGSIVTLDAGSVHQMQGIYIWSTFARMEAIKI